MLTHSSFSCSSQARPLPSPHPNTSGHTNPSHILLHVVQKPFFGPFAQKPFNIVEPSNLASASNILKFSSFNQTMFSTQTYAITEPAGCFFNDIVQIQPGPLRENKCSGTTAL